MRWWEMVWGAKYASNIYFKMDCLFKPMFYLDDMLLRPVSCQLVPFLCHSCLYIISLYKESASKESLYKGSASKESFYKGSASKEFWNILKLQVVESWIRVFYCDMLIDEVTYQVTPMEKAACHGRKIWSTIARRECLDQVSFNLAATYCWTTP